SFFSCSRPHPSLLSFPTRRSSDLIDPTQNLTAPIAQNPVERHRALPRLYKLHPFIFAHIETLPVDGKAVRILHNDGLGSLLFDTARASHNFATRRARIDGQCVNLRGYCQSKFVQAKTGSRREIVFCGLI